MVSPFLPNNKHLQDFLVLGCIIFLEPINRLQKLDVIAFLYIYMDPFGIQWNIIEVLYIYNMAVKHDLLG